jgi:hypothetical protein
MATKRARGRPNVGRFEVNRAQGAFLHKGQTTLLEHSITHHDANISDDSILWEYFTDALICIEELDELQRGRSGR